MDKCQTKSESTIQNALTQLERLSSESTDLVHALKDSLDIVLYSEEGKEPDGVVPPIAGSQLGITLTSFVECFDKNFKEMRDIINAIDL